MALQTKTSTRRNYVKPALLFVIWWGANSYYAIDAEIFFRRFNSGWHVFDLTLAQSIVGILMLTIWSTITCSNNGKSLFRTSLLDHSRTDLKLKTRLLLLAAGSVHTIGTALTAMSYSSLGATSTLVWKLTEPFSAVAMKAFILREAVMLQSSLAVCTVLSGVLTFSCRSFKISSYLPVITSNLVFPLRNSLVKLLVQETKSSEEQYFNILLHGLPLGLAAFAVRTMISPLNRNSFSLIMINAIIFNAYQFSSISLLSFFDTVTHSVLNTFKRFSAIFISMVVQKKVLFIEHLVGMNVALAGFVAYVIVKRGEKTSISALRSTFSRAFYVFFVALLTMIPILMSKTPPFPLSIEFFSNHKKYSLQEPKTSLSDSQVNVSHMLILRRSHEFETEGIFRSWESTSKDVMENWYIHAYFRLLDISFGYVLQCNTIEKCQYLLSTAYVGDIVIHMAESPISSLNNTLIWLLSLSEMPNVSQLILSGLSVDDYRMLQVILNVSLPSSENLNIPSLHTNDHIPKQNRTNSPYDYEFIANDYWRKKLMKTVHRFAFICGQIMTLERNDNDLGPLLKKRYNEVKTKLRNSSLTISAAGISINTERTHKLRCNLAANIKKLSKVTFHAFSQKELNLISSENAYNTKIVDNVNQLPNFHGTDLILSTRIDVILYAVSIGIPSLYITPVSGFRTPSQVLDVPYITIDEENGCTNFDLKNSLNSVHFDLEIFDLKRCLAAKDFMRLHGVIKLKSNETIKQISKLC